MQTYTLFPTIQNTPTTEPCPNSRLIAEIPSCYLPATSQVCTGFQNMVSKGIGAGLETEPETVHEIPSMTRIQRTAIPKLGSNKCQHTRHLSRRLDVGLLSWAKRTPKLPPLSAHWLLGGQAVCVQFESQSAKPQESDACRCM